MSHDPRLDDLRQRLRARGYLDAGVDRFVLGPTRSSGSPAVFTLLSSVRVGLLAALLLGPAATIGLIARMPGLVTGSRDAIVIALYLGAASGVAMTLATLAASVLVAAAAPLLPTRAGTLARAAGAAVSVVCLLYLTLWWQTVIAGVGWSSPVWTASALAIAVATSLLLGHAVSVVASALVMARAGAGDARATHSWRSSAIGGLVAFAGAALLLTWSGRSEGDTPSLPALTVVPSGLRLKVIAIDGFDPRLFEELSTSGRLPALTAAFAGATVDLAAEQNDSPDPARAWTTIATGQPARVHGVSGLEMRRVPGVSGAMPAAERSGLASALRNVTDVLQFTQPSIVSGIDRRAKTFWEIAAEAGLRSSVVNWWATWPAIAGDGVVLSDRATLRLEHGGTLDAEIAPPALYDDLRREWPALKARAVASARAAVGGRSADAASALLARSAELDAMQLLLLAAVSSEASDLAVVYLPGLDIAQHTLLGDHATAMAASALSERLQAVKDYYVVLDRLLVEHGAVAVKGDEAIVMLTQPGRIGSRTNGKLAVRGSAVSAAARSSASNVDVAPTLLYALGLPIAEDLGGRPIAGVFPATFTAKYPMRLVRTYGEPRRDTVARRGAPLDREMIERLRSLGYVR